jgi:hypothetical protein
MSFLPNRITLMNKIAIPLFAFLLFSESLVAQVDTVPPVVVCKQGLMLPVNFTGLAIAWATDFLDTAYDNTSPNLEFGIRKVCTGSDFPGNQTEVIFGASEFGAQMVEIWAKDAAGNESYCATNVDIYDPYGSIDPGYSFYLFTPENEGIDHSLIHVKGIHCLYDSVDSQYDIISGTWGMPGYWSSFGAVVPAAGYHFSVTPSKNINPLNGVSTYDLVLITKHILGIEMFDSPWKIIAADANQDGKVTTFDIVTLRKLILGITNELPNGKSWRFVPQDYTFPDPTNPFQPSFPERVEVPNTADPAPNSFAFKGVKIGDVDFSADPDQ